MKFAKNLKIMRKRHGLTQKELADLSGVSCNSIINYENSRRTSPPISVLQKLARALGTTVDVLIGSESCASRLATWISTKERLPENGDLVFVIANGKPKSHITLVNACLIASYWKDEGWIADGFEGWEPVDVTHWMPLPELPKGDTY